MFSMAVMMLASLLPLNRTFPPIIVTWKQSRKARLASPCCI
jgi:hypothetical protein